MTAKACPSQQEVTASSPCHPEQGLPLTTGKWRRQVRATPLLITDPDDKRQSSIPHSRGWTVSITRTHQRLAEHSPLAFEDEQIKPLSCNNSCLCCPPGHGVLIFTLGSTSPRGFCATVESFEPFSPGLAVLRPHPLHPSGP
jgi:hypothetical protein